MAYIPGKPGPYTPPSTGDQTKTVSDETKGKRAQLKKLHARTLSQTPGKPLVSLKTPNKPVKLEAPAKPFTAINAQIPPNPLSGTMALRNWEDRGKTAMIAFRFALGGIDKQAKLDAFYGPKGLWVVIKEVTDVTKHADVSELDGWIDHALKDQTKQDIESIVKSLKDGFGAKGDIYFNVRARLLGRAELLLKNSEADWNTRGAAQTKQVVAALLAGDTAQLKDAFYDPGFKTPNEGKNPKLYDIIKEKIGGNDPSQERASFDRWVGEALKGCSLDELDRILETINENAKTQVCPRGGVFQEMEGVLRQNIEERRLADEFVSTVLKGGDVDQAADRFGKRVRAVTGDDSQLTQARMVALIAAKLERLPLVNIAILKEECRDLPAYGGVTALRECLGMMDPKAVENLFRELEKGDRTEDGTRRLRALFRLADDQLRIGGSEEIKSRINAALKGLTEQQTISIAVSFQKLPISDQGIYPYLVNELSAAISAVAPQYFIRECLAYRSPPVDALKAMDEIVLSSNSVVSGGSPMNSVGVLRGAINRALVDLSSEELNRLTERLSEIDMSKVGRNIGNVFRRLVAERIQQLNKALENKYLLPQPLNIGPQN